MNAIKTVLPLLILFSSGVMSAQPEHWFNQQQVEQGEQLFKQNCASCHGQNAEETLDWKKTDVNGQYPPPPLNGTAHAWHHGLDLLQRTVREGGQKLGGLMPPFEDKLSAEQIDMVIAYFQSKWPDDIYQKWAGRLTSETKLPALTDVIDARKKDITRLLSQRLGNVKITNLEKTTLNGVWQVKLEDRYIYLIDDGNYAFMGDFFDLKKGRNLTELDRRVSAIDAIADYSDSDKIIYQALGEKKAELTVFTDTSCPYCRKLHKEISQLQKKGIQVSYLPFARGGKGGPGYQTLKSVWCAKDRNTALTDAKNKKTTGLPDGSCKQADIIDRAFKTGNKIGITGTPALFKSNGEQIQGYVPYQQLIPMVLGKSG